MNKVFVLVLLVVVLGIPLAAQGLVYAPSNTPATGGCNSWPFNVYTDWRFQFIVPAKFLPPACFKVCDLAVAPCSTRSPWSAKQFQVRMAATTVSNFSVAPTPNCFDTMLGSCPTVCYDGPISWKAVMHTWSRLGLQCCFAYNGTTTPQKNILVEIRYRSRTTSGVTVHTDGSIPRAYIHTGYTPNPYAAPCWKVPIPGQFMGPKVCLVIDRTCVLVGPDTVKVGGCCKYLLKQAPKGFYQFANSLSSTPGFTVGNCQLCLNLDGLFIASIMGGPPTFVNYSGVVSSTGQASAALCIPSIPGLAGLKIYGAALVFDAAGIKCCSNTHCKLIIP